MKADVQEYKPSTPLLGQANEASCVAASCRMAANLGEVPEAYIRNAINTDFVDGTLLSDIPKGLKELGFNGTAKYIPKINSSTIASSAKNGASVIVNLKTETGGVHAVVVDFIRDGRAYIKDPWPTGTGSAYSVPVKSLESALTGSAVVIKP